MDVQTYICLRADKAQVARMREAAQQCRDEDIMDVQMSTVDAFQGAEKDVIILATVRSSGVGFSSCPHRLNVALTRAKRHLIIVGAEKALGAHPLWKTIIEYASFIASSVPPFQFDGHISPKRLLDNTQTVESIFKRHQESAISVEVKEKSTFKPKFRQPTTLSVPTVKRFSDAGLAQHTSDVRLLADTMAPNDVFAPSSFSVGKQQPFGETAAISNAHFQANGSEERIRQPKPVEEAAQNFPSDGVFQNDFEDLNFDWNEFEIPQPVVHTIVQSSIPSHEASQSYGQTAGSMSSRGGESLRSPNASVFKDPSPLSSDQNRVNPYVKLHPTADNVETRIAENNENGLSEQPYGPTTVAVSNYMPSNPRPIPTSNACNDVEQTRHFAVQPQKNPPIVPKGAEAAVSSSSTQKVIEDDFAFDDVDLLF